MEKNSPGYDEMEIDLSKYVEVFVSRKKTFFLVFLLVLTAGFAYLTFCPKIYRISMIIQPPFSDQEIDKKNKDTQFEAAENLRGLVANGVFNEELSKRLNLGSNIPEFAAVIPDKTNILKVSVDLESKKKEFGIVLLNGLAGVISDNYAKRINDNAFDLADRIKQKERGIISAKEKAKNLQEQLKEVSAREDKLKEEIAGINTNTAQLLDKRQKLSKDNTSSENALIFLFTNFIQNNLSYSNQLNNQLSELSIRRANLNFEIKNIDSEISDFEMNIDKLKRNEEFISNVKIIVQPKASFNSVSPNKKKVVALLIFAGLFFGVLAVFAQEFWQENIHAKSKK